MPNPEEPHTLRCSGARKFFQVSALKPSCCNTLTVHSFGEPCSSGLWVVPVSGLRVWAWGSQTHPLRQCCSSTSSEETQLFHIPRVTSLKL